MANTENNKELNKQKAPSTDGFWLAIFARIWALWALITFITTFLVAYIFSLFSYLIPGYKGMVFFTRVGEGWISTWLFLIACPLKIKGLENFEKGKNYIVTFNHNALIDVTLSSPYIPGATKTIAKNSFAKIPFFGWYYARGSVLVDRKSDKSKVKSLEKMKKVLADGMHMCIYPEGTRNRTDKPLKAFFDGAFKLSVDTQKPIIPAIIFNTTKATPINKPFYCVPTKLEMHFLKPIAPNGLSVKELKQKVFDVMVDEYVNGMNNGK